MGDTARIVDGGDVLKENRQSALLREQGGVGRQKKGPWRKI